MKNTNCVGAIYYAIFSFIAKILIVSLCLFEGSLIIAKESQPKKSLTAKSSNQEQRKSILSKRSKARRSKKRNKNEIKLLPQTKKSAKAASIGFKQCRSKSLKELKAQKIDSTQLKLQLATCRERFPTANLYVGCKKRVLKEFRGSDKKEKLSQLQRCKELLAAASFDPENAIPFFVHKKRIFFAGIGFNKSIPLKDLELPNFDCQNAISQMENPEKAEYILFGNSPRSFEKLRGKKRKALNSLLGKRGWSSEEGVHVKRFGKIYGDPIGSDSAVFFPSASCVFSGPLGEIFEGITAYYLLDSQDKSLTPYFNVAFYKPEVNAQHITAEQIVEKTLKALGSNFSIMHQNKARTIIATHKIRSFDNEGDPKNICNSPRKHDIIAIIKNRADSQHLPHFVLLANTKQLCEYGDKVSNRL
ncbi:MAG: hypothetical protein R3B45_08125 [Bdellovibrionota bacterium]